MGVAFKAPRAPIERPKPPSSRFSFYRRRYTFSRDKILRFVVLLEYLNDNFLTLSDIYRRIILIRVVKEVPLKLLIKR